jgi:hypothetical protein
LKLIGLLLRSRCRAHLAEVVALAYEFPPGGGDLLDRLRLGELAHEPLRLGLVSGPQRVHCLLALVGDLSEPLHELLVRVADLGRRVERGELGREPAQALEPLGQRVALLLGSRIRRRLDPRAALELRDECLEALLVLGLRQRRVRRRGGRGGGRLRAAVVAAARDQEAGGTEGEQRLQTGITSM